MAAGAGASKEGAVNERALTGGASARGFDFGDSGGGGANGGPLSFEQLGQLLQSLGSAPQVHAGMYVYQIKEESGLTYPLVISLSQDQRAVYFLVPLVPVDPQGWANQESLFKLLAGNSVICPASFGIVGQKLFLLLGVANMNVSAESLKLDISYMFETVHKTKPLWVPWMGTGGGGGNSGGGNPFQ